MFIGKVVRPNFEDGDKNVKLTATVTKGSVTKTVSFDTIVKKLGITDGQSVIKDLAALVVPSEATTNIELPTTGLNGTKIAWSSDLPGSITNMGLVTRPNVGEENSTVTLTATVTKGTESQSKDFTVTVIAWTVDDELSDARSLVTWELIAGTNASINMVMSNLVLPNTIGRDVAVTWVSSNKDFCDTDGTITRPTYTQGPVIISVAATLTKDEKTLTQTITGIRLEPAAITNKEIALDASNKLSEAAFLGENASLSQIVDDMKLPITIAGLMSESCTYGWSVVDNDDQPVTTPYVTLQSKASHVECAITRPNESEGNFICYLKAIATANDIGAGETGTSEKRFRIVVLAQA